MPNPYRKILADRIAANGGYYGHGYDKPTCLEWTVGLYCGVDDLEDITQSEDFKYNFGHADKLASKEGQRIFKRAVKRAAKTWNTDRGKSNVWEWVRDDMCESLDCDAYRSLSPAIARKWGIKEDTYFNVKWTLEGRGGKHLCLSEFEGYSLKFKAEDVAEWLVATEEDPSWGNGFSLPNSVCTSLIAFIEECDKMFAGQKVEAEFRYQCTFHAAQWVEREWAEAQEDIAARRLKKTVRQALPTLGSRRVLDVCESVIQQNERDTVKAA